MNARGLVVLPKVTDTSEVHPINALVPMDVRPSGNDMDTSTLQFMNPKSPIVSGLVVLPKVTYVSAVQLAKVFSPIEERPAGSSRVVKELQP